MRDAPDERDLFALLGIDARAPWEQVRRAYRNAVLASHPDLHPGDLDAERRLKVLIAGWEAINTPEKWAAYTSPTGPASDGGAGRDTTGATVAWLGRIRIQRQVRGSAGLSNWSLELDGEVVASIENGGVSILEAEPGRHSLRVFYGGRSSVPLELDLRRGEELALGCRQLEGLRTGLFSPKRSLVIEPLGSRRFA